MFSFAIETAQFLEQTSLSALIDVNLIATHSDINEYSNIDMHARLNWLFDNFSEKNVVFSSPKVAHGKAREGVGLAKGQFIFYAQHFLSANCLVWLLSQ